MRERSRLAMAGLAVMMAVFVAFAGAGSPREASANA